MKIYNNNNSEPSSHSTYSISDSWQAVISVISLEKRRPAMVQTGAAKWLKRISYS